MRMNDPFALGRVQETTHDFWMEQWLSNMLALRDSRLTLPDLSAFPPNNAETAIICGSGPSLNNDLPFLAKLQSKDGVLIFANHSNLATLLYERILPFGCVIADSSPKIPERWRRDLFPHYKHQMGMLKYFLPSCALLDLVSELQKRHLTTYFWTGVANEINPTVALFNKISRMILPQIESRMFQVGCVSNATLFLLMQLSANRLLPNLKRIFFSGVDFSFPNGITRCKTVTYNKTQFVVDEKPTEVYPEQKLIKMNGLLTDITSYFYRMDLQSLLEGTISFQSADPKEQKVVSVAELYEFATTAQNFISDFMPVKSLEELL